jgi:hypothetical protein
MRGPGLLQVHSKADRDSIGRAAGIAIESSIYESAVEMSQGKRRHGTVRVTAAGR